MANLNPALSASNIFLSYEHLQSPFSKIAPSSFTHAQISSEEKIICAIAYIALGLLSFAIVPAIYYLSACLKAHEYSAVPQQAQKERKDDAAGTVLDALAAGIPQEEIAAARKAQAEQQREEEQRLQKREARNRRIEKELPEAVPMEEEGFGVGAGAERAVETKKDLLTPVIGMNYGIQGENNSCYLDAALFAMFATTNAFDFILTEQINDDHEAKEIRQILRDIVQQLRENKFVPASSKNKLRTILFPTDMPTRETGALPQKEMSELTDKLNKKLNFQIETDRTASDEYEKYQAAGGKDERADWLSNYQKTQQVLYLPIFLVEGHTDFNQFIQQYITNLEKEHEESRNLINKIYDPKTKIIQFNIGTFGAGIRQFTGELPPILNFDKDNQFRLVSAGALGLSHCVAYAWDEQHNQTYLLDSMAARKCEENIPEVRLSTAAPRSRRKNDNDQYYLENYATDVFYVRIEDGDSDAMGAGAGPAHLPIIKDEQR